jgi:ABC-type branched-subunit amino acid transport system substrate-binding protein
MRNKACAKVAQSTLAGNSQLYPWLLRMMAPDSVQSAALADLARHYGWTKMAILTSDTDYGESHFPAHTPKVNCSVSHRNQRPG